MSEYKTIYTYQYNFYKNIGFSDQLARQRAKYMAELNLSQTGNFVNPARRGNFAEEKWIERYVLARSYIIRHKRRPSIRRGPLGDRKLGIFINNNFTKKCISKIPPHTYRKQRARKFVRLLRRFNLARE